MNDLAYDSLFCDHNSFGFFGHPSSYMSNNDQEIFSNDFDTPSGYLQDVLVDRFHDKSKKRRLVFFSENQSYKDDSSSSEWDLYENLNCLTKNDVLYESRNNVGEETKVFKEIKKHEDEMLGYDHEDTIFSSQDSYKENSGDSANSVVSMLLHSGEQKNQNNKKIIKRSPRKVYPFSVVKPGGINEGEVTLNEINERLSKPLSRRVKHPVGEYACKPNVTSLNGGPGLSGKAVVSLTRIHTLGRGTITIIRTKG